MRSTPLACSALSLSVLLYAASALAQQTPTPIPTQPPAPPGRPLDLPRTEDPNAPTLGASLRAGYQIRAAVQTVEANPLIFIQKDGSARVCRAPLPREGAIAPRYTPDFGIYRCSEIK
jgi:hypothetical protein